MSALNVSSMFFRDFQDLVRKNIYSSCLKLPEDIAQLIAEYVIVKGSFNAHNWLNTCTIKIVGEEPVLPLEFYKFWFGIDPIDRSKYVCETHLPPILCPKEVKSAGSEKISNYSLDLLKKLMGGNLTQDYWNPSNIEPILLARREVSASKLCWVVMRKELLGPHSSYNESKEAIKEINKTIGAGYEEECDILDLATIFFIHHLITGNLLGLWTAKGKPAYPQAKETVRYEYAISQCVIVQRWSYPGILLGRAGGYWPETLGVALLRKFY